MSMREPCALCGVVEWAYGVKYEQERIIELLEDYCQTQNKSRNPWPASNVNNLCIEITNHLIALIKGEK